MVAYYIASELEKEKISKIHFIERSSILQTTVFLRDRANDLGLCLSQEVSFFTKYRGFAISSHGWENIKEWKVNEFVVPKNDDSTILCPLRA